MNSGPAVGFVVAQTVRFSAKIAEKFVNEIKRVEGHMVGVHNLNRSIPLDFIKDYDTRHTLCNCVERSSKRSEAKTFLLHRHDRGF